MRYFFIVLFAVILFSSCKESNEPVKLDNYLIYYSVSNTESTLPGFFEIDFLTGIEKTIATTPTVYQTKVAENGIVIYERDKSFQQRLIGLCEAGVLINVPFPVHHDPDNFKFEYDMPPHPFLSFNGHNLAYFVNAIDLNNDNSNKIPHLVIYNCNINDTTILDLSDFVSTSKYSQFDSYKPIGKHLITNYDASTIFFAVGFLDENGESVDAYQVAKYENGSFSWIADYIMTEPMLLSYDDQTKLLNVRVGNEIHLYDEMNNLIIRNMYVNSSNTPNQYAQYSRQMVYLDETGVYLAGINSDQRNWSIVTISELVEKFGEFELKSDMPSAISQDGEIIVFAAQSKLTGLFDIFSVDRKGTKLTRIKPSTIPEYISISAPIKE